MYSTCCCMIGLLGFFLCVIRVNCIFSGGVCESMVLDIGGIGLFAGVVATRRGNC
jgi:hypothetical protein